MEWKLEDNKLKKTFQFTDFKEAFAFMKRVAIVADKMNHHPTWTNMYNRVDIELSTHEAGNTVTEKDHALAAAMDGLTQS